MVHDVPVGVIPQRNWDDYEEPAMPDFDVSVDCFLHSLTKSPRNKRRNIPRKSIYTEKLFVN